ncbi:MAG TPA: cyclase family protein, partial [Hyphomicrobiaceae bacterium]|nr:cyclase family protein [Hyphomicrobiaceae bacterium]
ELVLKAVGLVKQGKVATLGKIYAADAPAFGTRSWKLVIPGMPTGGPFGGQKLVYNDEYVPTELGQIGSQFDGPGHIGVITSKGMFYYNGRFLSDKGISAAGLGPLGVQHVGQKGFVCRGVLLCGGVARGTIADPEREQRFRPRHRHCQGCRGDGEAPRYRADWSWRLRVPAHRHGNIWHPKDWDTYDAAEKVKRVAQFNAGEPGFGISACEYLAEHKIILTGADTWAVEAVGKDAGGETPQPFECHIKMQTKRGIWNLENLDLTQLVADKAYEFLFVWSPLKMKGATGSPGNPIALY